MSVFLGHSLDDGYELDFDSTAYIRRSRGDVSLGVSQMVSLTGTGLAKRGKVGGGEASSRQQTGDYDAMDHGVTTYDNTYSA